MLVGGRVLGCGSRGVAVVHGTDVVRRAAVLGAGRTVQSDDAAFSRRVVRPNGRDVPPPRDRDEERPEDNHQRREPLHRSSETTPKLTSNLEVTPDLTTSLGL